METVPMLSDVDDARHYAYLLEVAYVEALCELEKILKAAHFAQPYIKGGPRPVCDEDLDYDELTRLHSVMSATVEQSITRRRRLAHIARGLSDVVLDEEGSEE